MIAAAAQTNEVSRESARGVRNADVAENGLLVSDLDNPFVEARCLRKESVQRRPESAASSVRPWSSVARVQPRPADSRFHSHPTLYSRSTILGTGNASGRISDQSAASGKGMQICNQRVLSQVAAEPIIAGGVGKIQQQVWRPGGVFAPKAFTGPNLCDIACLLFCC